MDPPLLAAAVELAALGWPMFFIRPRNKEPFRGTGGFKDATTDEQALRDLFKRRRGRVNLAVATGAPGPTVLDIDNPTEAAAKRVLAQLNGLNQPTVATVRGRHLYFAGTAASTVGLDYGELRGVGSYVVVPPSIHASGKEYVWLESPTAQLPPLPDLLTGLQPAGTGQHDARERVAHGERHDYLKDFAVRVVRSGITDQATIKRMLEAEYEVVCDKDPPAKRNEFRDIAKWATRTRLADRERAAADAPEWNIGVGKKKRSQRKKTGLENPPNGDAPLAEHRQYVCLAGGWSDRIDVKNVRRYGVRGEDALDIRLSNDQLIVFDQQDHITVRGRWAKTITHHTHGIADPLSLSDWEALKVLRSLCILAGAPPERREQEDLRDALLDFLGIAEPIGDHDLGTHEGRYEAIARCRARPKWDPRDRGSETQPVLLVDVTGRYVRAGELRDYLVARNIKIAWSALPGRMHMIGAEGVDLNGREAAHPDHEGRRKQNHMRVYRVPDDL